MHRTNTVDYSVVFDGEIWLELDDGKTIHLKRGDWLYKMGRGTPGGIKAHSLSPCSFS
jgi:quercetin dioxygenase-like cupin family protein